jgi:hypothetical protein
MRYAICLLSAALLLSYRARCDTRIGSVVDDFRSRGSWSGPIYQYGDRSTGDAAITDGVLRVTHAPRARYHMVSMEKAYSLDFSPGTAFHTRFRCKERLLGADMYVTLTLDGKQLVQLGVNGEMHWRMFKQCALKAWDDELFWGSPLIRGAVDYRKTTDFRTALPKARAGKLLYTDWHLLSVCYDGAGDERRLRVFVDGDEVPYRDLDAAAPQGRIDTHFAPGMAPLEQRSKLTVSLGLMTDGDLYGDTRVNGGAGVRWLHAFADNTPAIPSPTDPAAAVKRNATVYWDYLIIASPTTLGSIAPDIRRLLREGRLDRRVAAKLGLLPRGATAHQR